MSTLATASSSLASSSASTASAAINAISSAQSSIVTSAASSMPSLTPIHTQSTWYEKVTADAIANGLTTLIGALVGALVGAMLAYWLQRRFQKVQEVKADLMSAHRLMFAILHQINTILLIQREYVFTHLNDPMRFLSIPPTLPFDTKKDTLDSPDLSFLMVNKNGRSTAYLMYMAQQNYIAALEQWNMRSTLHHEKVQVALSNAGVDDGAPITSQEIQRIIGLQTYWQIVGATDNSIASLQNAFQILNDAKAKARIHFAKRFKTTDFTDFRYVNTFGLVYVPAQHFVPGTSAETQQ